MAEHTPDWAETGDSSRSVLHAKSLNQLRSEDGWMEKYENLSRKLEALEMKSSEPQVEICNYCSVPGHTTQTCPNIPIYQ